MSPYLLIKFINSILGTPVCWKYQQTMLYIVRPFPIYMAEGDKL